jgi:predicted transcriptional regulator
MMAGPLPVEADDETVIQAAALSAGIAEARRQAAAGQVIPLADMVRWLDSWGTAAELPPPPWK